MGPLLQLVHTAHLTVVKQQNVAVGEQQVALVEGPGGRRVEPEAVLGHSQQEGAPALLNHVKEGNSSPGPQAGRDREEDSAEVEGLHARGA